MTRLKIQNQLLPFYLTTHSHIFLLLSLGSCALGGSELQRELTTNAQTHNSIPKPKQTHKHSPTKLNTTYHSHTPLTWWHTGWLPWALSFAPGASFSAGSSLTSPGYTSGRHVLRRRRNQFLTWPAPSGHHTYYYT